MKTKPPFTQSKHVRYTASDGTHHDTLADVQKAELSTIFGGEHGYDELLDLLVATAPTVVAILKVKERKPKAKAPKAAKKERKALGKGIARDKENNEGNTPSPDGNKRSVGEAGAA